MTTNLDSLKACLQQYSWFNDAQINQHNKIVVFVNSMSSDINSIIPENFDNTQVLVHFALSKDVSKDKYCNIFNSVSELKDIIPIKLKRIIITPNDLQDKEDFLDVKFLKSELDRLISLSNLNIVQSIFYESHDKANSITNLSSLYPEIGEAIEYLYGMYGFDVMYEILE